MKVFRVGHAQDQVTERAIESGSRKAPVGSVLLVVRGMILAHTFPVCLTTRDLAFNQDVKAVVPNQGLDGTFLAHWFVGNGEKMLGLVTEATHGTKRIDLRDLLDFAVTLPPLPEQKLIASILDTVDEVIRKTEEVIAKLQLMKQGLLHDLLTRGIDDNGDLRDPDRHPEQFKDSPLGRIPKQWGVDHLQNLMAAIVDYRGMTPPYTTTGVAVISQEDVQLDGLRSTSKWVSKEVADEWTHRGSVTGGETVFRMERFVGEVVRIPTDQRYIITRGVLALRPAELKLSRAFLYWQMYYLCRRGNWRVYNHATTVPRMYKPELLAQPLAYPRLEEQRVIETMLDCAGGRESKEAAELNKLRLLKAGLMDDLLTGRVRVTDLLDSTP